MGKKPWFALYPKDWQSDGIFGCTLAARGLWFEMMNVMHGCEPYGYLCENGRPMTDERIARRCGTTLPEYIALLAELDAAGIPRRTKSGIIFSKRMVGDEKQRKEWRNRQKKHRDADCDVTQVSRSSHTVLHSAFPSALPKKEKERENIPPAKSAGLKPTAEFLVFWESYPKKLGKQEALKAWIRRGCEGRLGEVLASLKAWSDVEWKGREREFIPHPATWLNADRWKETPQLVVKPIGETLEDKRKRLERELGDGQGSGTRPNQHSVANAH